MFQEVINDGVIDSTSNALVFPFKFIYKQFKRYQISKNYKLHLKRNVGSKFASNRDYFDDQNRLNYFISKLEELENSIDFNPLRNVDRDDGKNIADIYFLLKKFLV